MKNLIYLLIAALLFTFTACSEDDENPVAGATYKISGTVTTPDGAGLAGATVNLTGADIETTTTDANGNYEFAGLDAGDYVVTATSTEYDFVQPVVTITGLAKDEVADFAAKELHLGTWLSVGTDIAPLLVSLFSYDSVRVTFNSDQTVQLETHILNGAWTTTPGVYTINKSATGSVHSISINYTAFEQGGIIEVTKGTPDELKLEVVQTTPDIGAVPRTPASGFGSDAALGVLNIQNYVRIN